jgi:hypothetical protein
VVKEAKDLEKEVPSVIAKYSAITFKASRNPPFVVWLDVVVSSASLGKTRLKRTSRRRAIYIFEVLKQVHPDTRVSSKATRASRFGSL